MRYKLVFLIAAVCYFCASIVPDILANDEVDKQLIQAAMRGNLDSIQAAYTSGVQVNDVKNENGNHLLHLAAIYNQLQIAELLIKNKVDSNIKGFGKRTPLHWAAIGGYTKVTKLLIHNGAEVNSTDDSGRTPLHWAVKYGDAEMISQMILRGAADISIKNIKGDTSLKTAKKYPQKDTFGGIIALAGPGGYDAPLDECRQDESTWKRAFSDATTDIEMSSVRFIEADSRCDLDSDPE